jgi:hypothetical protein
MKRVIGVVTTFLTVALSRDGRTTDQYESSIPVQVVISAPEGIRGEIMSYMTRELRSLPGVVVTDQDPVFKISVVAVTINDPLTTYAVSVVTESMLPARTIHALPILLASKLSKEDVDMIRKVPMYGAVASHELRTASPATLQALCRQEIAYIDGSSFEPFRKMQLTLIKASKLH